MLAPPKLQTLPSSQQDWPTQGNWRYEDYLRLPDDGKRYEIIEGVLYVANAPSFEHQYVVAQLMIYLGLFVKEKQLGVVLPAPFEVHLSNFSRPVQPDLLFIDSKQRFTIGTQSFEGVSNLIVEVISPSSIRLDRQVKFDAYEAAGVEEYWIANPKTHSVEVYTLSNGEYALLGEYAGEEKVESKVLSGLSIPISVLFNT